MIYYLWTQIDLEAALEMTDIIIALPGCHDITESVPVSQSASRRRAGGSDANQRNAPITKEVEWAAVQVRPRSSI